MDDEELSERCADLVDRIRAMTIAGKDPHLLQFALRKLLEKKDDNAKSQPVRADGRRPRRSRAPRS